MTDEQDGGGVQERLSRPAITVARTRDEVEALRHAWRRFKHDHVTADIDTFLGVLDDEPTVLRPHVLVVGERQAPTAIVVARLEQRPLPLRFGYKTVLAPKVRAVTVVYRGALGPLTGELADLVVDELLGALKRREADIVFFRQLPLGSELHRAAATRPGRLARQHLGESEVCWELELPDTYEQFLLGLSRKTREKHRYYAKRLHRDFEGAVELRSFRRPEELNGLTPALEAVASRTYQRALGTKSFTDPGERNRLREGLAAGTARAFVLYLAGRPVAFWYGDVYQGRLRTAIPGFDPEFADYRVGTYVLLALIEDACADEAVRIIDLGIGDAEYKQRYGTRSWRESNVIVFSTSPRGLTLNGAATALRGLARAGEAVATRTGLVGAVKRSWRNRLRSASRRADGSLTNC